MVHVWLRWKTAHGACLLEIRNTVQVEDENATMLVYNLTTCMTVAVL